MEQSLLDEDRAVYARMRELDLKRTAMTVIGDDGTGLPTLIPVPWTEEDEAEYARLHHRYYGLHQSVRDYYKGM